MSRQAATELGVPVEDLNMVIFHLGNGASASAVRGGRAIETSMGLTPLQGLVMGTRSGDIDPSIYMFLHDVAEHVDQRDRHRAQQAVRGQGLVR